MHAYTRERRVVFTSSSQSHYGEESLFIREQSQSQISQKSTDPQIFYDFFSKVIKGHILGKTLSSYATPEVINIFVQNVRAFSDFSLKRCETGIYVILHSSHF